MDIRDNCLSNIQFINKLFINHINNALVFRKIHSKFILTIGLFAKPIKKTDRLNAEDFQK